MAGRDEQLLSGIPAPNVGVQNSINSPNPTPAPYFPIQQHQNIHQIQQQPKPFYQTSHAQISYLPHMNPSQYRQISPQHIAPHSTGISGFQIRSPMSVIHGPSQVQPGHFIRMPDGKMGKVISTDRSLPQQRPSPNSLRNLSHNSPPRSPIPKPKTTQKQNPPFRLHQFDFLSTTQQKPSANKQQNKRKSSDDKTTSGKILMPDFKRKKTPSKDESRKMELVAAKMPKMASKETPKSRVEPKRRLPDFEKINKELMKKNKPRVDEWGPMEVIKKRDFEWPALPSDTKIIWNNPFYQPYSLTKIAVDELEATLQKSTSTEFFDVKRYIEKIISETQRFIANPFNENIQKQFSFQEAGKIKIWRCPNSAFIFEDDSDTLRVTVAMCKSINANVTKYNGRKKELKNNEKIDKKEPFSEENSMTDEEAPSSSLSEPNTLDSEGKADDSVPPKAKEKLSSIGEIQDSPCMRYLTRVFANKKQDSFIRRGIGDFYVCAVCDKLYWKDFSDFQKSHCNERSLYYNEHGAYDASPDLTRQIACAFQGLRRLCPGKAVSASTSVEDILRDKRGLKPSSFTNTKTIPEWYHRLFLPSDDFREVMMAPNTAFHLLAILWGDIREMLLEEIEWDKKVNCDYLEGSFKQLRMRYGKNTLKRVIPGVRETCDNCKTSLFNSHYICTSCGGTICPKCASKNIQETNLKKIYFCEHCHTYRHFPDDRNTVLPISFIPIEAVKNMHYILQTVMSRRPSQDVPDVCHPLSAERYLKDKRVIPHDFDMKNCNKEQINEILRREQAKVDKETKEPLLKDIEDILNDPLSDFESSDSDDPAISVSPSEDELSLSDLGKMNKIEQRIDSSGKVHSRFKATVEIVNTKHFRDTVNSVVHLDGKKSKSALDASIYSHWSRQEPIVVYDLHQHSSFEMKIWSVEYFKQNYSDERAILIDCRKNDQLQKSALKDFWLGFADYDQRYLKSSKKPPIYKLKDWPTTDDICKKMPLHFKAFKEFLPCHEICQRDGALNLAKYLPKYFCIPDLGPKMYIAYGWLEEFIDKSKQEIFMKMKQGSTDCHIDISGAVNIMTNVVEPVNSFTERQRSDALRNLLVEGGLSDEEIQNFAESGRKPGALWHIWPVRDTEKIRKLLHKQDEEQYEKESGNDAIHDQDTYITSDIRKMLEKNGIRGKHILQCEGDAVFIPSGAIHQVLNINSCIKIACDFISPQCVRRSLITTEELRHLSYTHQNREDKLQLKAHLFHTAKEIFSSILWEPIFTQKLHQKPKHS